jgi:hypothetical protein
MKVKRSQQSPAWDFTYSVVGDVLRTDRAKQNLSRSNFEKVLPLLPLPGPGQISNEVRGPAYVWAILHDKRIDKETGNEPYNRRVQPAARGPSVASRRLTRQSVIRHVNGKCLAQPFKRRT